MKTKTRLMIWLGTLLLLVTVLAGVGMASIWKLRADSRNVMKANYNSIEYMQRMFDAMEAADDTATSHRLLEAQLALQRANITEPGEREATEQLAGHLLLWRQQRYDPSRARALHQDILRIIDLNRLAIVRKARNAEDRAESAVIWISVVGAISVLIAFTLFLSLPELIAEPIRKLTEGIERIAAGHYRERVELRRNDEFGHMALRFNAMAAELEKWQNSNLARIMEEKARAEAVINSLQDASVGLDEQGNILFMNRQALDLLGLEEQEVLGRPAATVGLHNDLLRHVLDDRSGAPFKAVLGGKENYFVPTASTIQGAQGPLGTVHTIRNITPFQERDQAKTHFLATITHELKTPLASTDLGLTLLERRIGNENGPGTHAIIADLRKDHQRLVRIVSELLDLAQVETGNIRLEMGEVPVAQAIRNAMDSVKMSAQERTVRFEGPAIGPEVLVKADADKAVWVLVNLLSNAVRHSPKGGTVGLQVVNNGEDLLIKVTDQGPGVPEEERTDLFKPFAHQHIAHKGTGLGLAIARQFMRAMGGDIRYEDQHRSGAVFVLVFKLA